MDQLHKFLFEGRAVRGSLVRLEGAWQDMLSRRAATGAYPPPVRELLGQMTAAAALMQSGITFDGALVLQISGDGPVKLLVAEARTDLALRSTATVVGAVPPGATLQTMVNPHGGARCALTLDSGNGQPYQGVVPLTGAATLAEALGHYMQQSEQVDSHLVLAANDTVAAGLLVQRLPTAGQGNLGGDAGAEDFNHIRHLAATLTAQELLTLPADTILNRLFWEERLTRFAPLTPRFACTCSKERVSAMLQGLGRAEVDSIIAERGAVDVGCEFCGAQYRFDAVDAATLFTTAHSGPTTLQ